MPPGEHMARVTCSQFVSMLFAVAYNCKKLSRATYNHHLKSFELLIRAECPFALT